MSIPGGFHAKRAEQRNVLGGVAEVIFATDDMRDAHLEIVNHVDEMKHGFTVAADDDKVGVGFLAVGKLAQHVAHDQVGNEDRVALHLELDCPLVFVSQAM